MGVAPALKIGFYSSLTPFRHSIELKLDGDYACLY